MSRPTFPRIGLFDAKDPVSVARTLSLYEANVAAYSRDRDAKAYGPFTRTQKQTSAYGAKPWEYVRVDPTGGAVSVVLPRITDAGVKGSVIIVKNASASSHTITISAVGTTIDGAASNSFAVARGVRWFCASDDEWEVIV